MDQKNSKLTYFTGSKIISHPTLSNSAFVENAIKGNCKSTPMTVCYARQWKYIISCYENTIITGQQVGFKEPIQVGFLCSGYAHICTKVTSRDSGPGQT